MNETVWKVDRFMDKVRECESKKAFREQYFLGSKTEKRYEIFATEYQAFAFMAQRAIDEITKAEAKLARAHGKHKKCNKLLNDYYARNANRAATP